MIIWYKLIEYDRYKTNAVGTQRGEMIFTFGSRESEFCENTFPCLNTLNDLAYTLVRSSVDTKENLFFSFILLKFWINRNTVYFFSPCFFANL